MTKATPQELEALRVGSRVKYSSKFIRSIGNVGIWRAEVIGTVIDMFKAQEDWHLALIAWDGGNGFSEANIQNLVALRDVDKESRRTEHKENVRGLVIGSNAYAQY